MTLAARLEDFEVTLEHMLMDVFVSVAHYFIVHIARTILSVSAEYISGFRHIHRSSWIQDSNICSYVLPNALSSVGQKQEHSVHV